MLPVGVGGREIKRRFAVPPSLGSRVLAHLRRGGLAGRDADRVRDAHAVADAARGPLARRGLQDPGLSGVRDQKSVRVAPVEIARRRPALAETFDQPTDEIHPLARRGGALQSQPHQIHPEQAGTRHLVLGRHRLIADRHAAFVDSVLEAPEPRRTRPGESPGLLTLRDLDILTSEATPAAMLLSRLLCQRLTLRGWAVAVLGEQAIAAGTARRQRD